MTGTKHALLEDGAKGKECAARHIQHRTLGLVAAFAGRNAPHGDLKSPGGSGHETAGQH